MRYIDFVDLDYEPSEKDLICGFHLETAGPPLNIVAGGVAAESSIGTWTELTTVKPYMAGLQATTFEIKENDIRVAYPHELFEPGNMPNILSSVSGNVFGLEDIKSLRLNEIKFPAGLMEGFKGPKYGIDGIRKLLGLNERPLVGTIIKPKLGLRTEDHAKIAYEAWRGGCDIVKDDENLSGQAFNPFEDRLRETLEARDRAEEETGETKVYMVNVTAETDEMIRRAGLIEDQGGRYMMVDILTCGWSALQTLRDRDFDLVIHAHRAGHAAFTRSHSHGINMRVIAKVARIIGVDQLHVGTAVGKMAETATEVKGNIRTLLEPLHGIKEVFPVASGGLYPGLIPALMKIFGKDFVIQAGGGIHGHPDGSVSGARAMRQAVDAVMAERSLEDYADDHVELETALDTWSGS